MKSELDLGMYMLPGIEMKWLRDFDESLYKHIAAVREAGKKLGALASSV